MTPSEALVSKLENLKSAGKKQVTLDIDYLLQALSSVSAAPQIRTRVVTPSSVDGGGFKDE